MKKLIAVVSLVVLGLSLTAMAADHRNMVRTEPKAGTAYKAPIEATAPVYNNLDVAYPKGVYYPDSGWYIVGAKNTYGIPNFAEGEQFTLSAAATVSKVVTGVNYAASGTYTDFWVAIEADSSGVPSGTPIAKTKITVDSQTFGACCAVESKHLSASLAAGTYWIVWYTDKNSDLVAEVNVSIQDMVDSQNFAYSESNGAAGTWTAYTDIFGMAAELK